MVIAQYLQVQIVKRRRVIFTKQQSSIKIIQEIANNLIGEEIIVRKREKNTMNNKNLFKKYVQFVTAKQAFESTKNHNQKDV